MHNRPTVLASCIAGALIFFCSCRKDLSLSDNKEITSTPLAIQSNQCRVESIWENPGLTNQRIRLVLYDEFENPVAITTPVVNSGSSYRTFKYDHWHRLKEFRSEFSRGFFETWHFYGYNLAGQINVDTTYIFGDMKNGIPENYFERTIEYIEYDDLNRVSKTTWTDTHGSNIIKNYEYNSRGNLILPGVVYDDMVNLNRTNDIWMFINRDYSLNNPFVAGEFNESGLPTSINVLSPIFIGFAKTDINLRNCKISYSCRPAQW